MNPWQKHNQSRNLLAFLSSGGWIEPLATLTSAEVRNEGACSTTISSVTKAQKFRGKVTTPMI